MWHEARRQEKKIRGLMVDFKRRADRRREFYEKIKQDPTQFLRMYGRPVKIHLDPAVAMAAEGPQSMMPWQGDSSNMIDRFDVRANLDIIPDFTGVTFEENPNYDEDEERWANYERYRTLVESEASGLTEEQCLHQIYLDEHFGTITKSNEEEKKKNADKKAAIGFVYEDSTPVEKKEDSAESEEESEDDLDTADLDVTIDVDTLTREQAIEVNLCASQYGMKEDDFVRLLRRDKEELEAIKEARQLEEAKAQFSGRKSRRERRAINEKKHNPHRFNRPSYAARESPKYEPYKRPGSSSRSRSRSRSRSPETVKVKFITSFGNESDDEGVVQGPVLPASVQLQPTAKTKNLESSKCETPWLARRGSSQTKKDTSKPRRSLSRSRSRSRSRRRRRSSSRSSSSRSRRSRSRSRSGSRQRRYSPGYRRSSGRDRSRRSNRSNSRRHSSSSRSRSRSKSRSRSPAHSPKKRSRSKTPEPAPVIKRYRRESLSSNSGLSGIESDGEDNSNSNQSSFTNRDKNALDSSKLLSLSGGSISSKALTQKTRETPQERLKRRMQAQLNKQFKADKKAEITKISKQEQDRLDREEEIRNLALEMRRREREKRHREKEEEDLKRPKSGSRSGSNSSRSNSSRSQSSSSEKSLDRRRRSRSQKTPDKRSDDRSRTSSDARSAERGNMDRSKDHRRDSDRKPEGRGNSDSMDRRRREDDDNWSNRREGRRWDSGNGGRDWRRDTQPSPRNERWDSDRRDRYPDRDRDRDMRDRDGRRNYRDRNDRDSDESRWRSRPGPPRPYLLPRPGSPQRSYRHPRN